MWTDPYRSTPAHEARLRRLIRDAGYALRRSRWRADTPDNLSGFMIVDPDRNTVAAGGRYDLTPDDVEAWLRNK